MANEKISDLTQVVLPLTGTEELPIVQGGVTKKITVDNLNTPPAWGDITGTLSAQTDLQTALDLKADVAILSNGIDAFAHAKRVSEAGGTTIDIIPLDEVIRASRGSASLLITPNSIATSKVFSQLPDSSAGDFPFVRASTATQINKYGILETVASGVPRRDYTNGVPALLIEPQRTNLITYSDGDITTYPTKGNVSNAVTPISGFSNSVYFDANTVLRYAYKTNFTPIVGVAYNLSCFIQMDDGGIPVIGTNAITGDFAFVMNGSVGTNDLVVTLVSGSIYRVSASKVATSGYTSYGIIKYTGQSSRKFKISGIQLEAGSNTTSYIPTVASTITRVADTMSKTGISDLIGQSEGVLFLEISALNDDLTSRYISLSDGTYNNMINMRYSTITNQIDIRVYSSNNLQAIFLQTITITNFNKIALSYKLNQVKLFVNGVQLGSTDTSAIMPIGMSTLQLTNGNASASPFYGKINKLQLYKTALTDAQLTALTTL